MAVILNLLFTGPQVFSFLVDGSSKFFDSKMRRLGRKAKQNADIVANLLFLEKVCVSKNTIHRLDQVRKGKYEQREISYSS